MKKFLLALLTTLFAYTANAQPVVTLTPENMIALRSRVDDDTVSSLIAKIEESDQDTIYLYINSPGGSIDAGNQLIQTIKNSGKKVICIANFAASMAFSILQSCDERLVQEDAVVMQHEAAYESKGNLTAQRRELTIVTKIADKLNRRDAARIGMDLKKFKALIHEEWWLYDDEIVENHVADSMVGVQCSPELSKAREVTSIDSLFGKIVLTWSQCPLETYPVKVEMKMKLGIEQRDFRSWVQDQDMDQNWKQRTEHQ